MLSKPLVYAITFVVCILLQAAVAPNIAILGAQPDFLLIPVVLVALRSGIGTGSLAGFALGVLYDAMSSGTIGCMALVFVLLAWAVGALGANVDTDSVTTVLIFALAAALFSECLYACAVLLTTTDASGALGAFLRRSLVAFVYTAVFSCIALSTITLVAGEGTNYQPRVGQAGSAQRGKDGSFGSRLN